MTLCRSRGTRSMFPGVFLAIAMLAVIPYVIAEAAPLPFGMPSVTEVLNTVHGKAALDTAARRCGVFDQLISMLAVFEGPRQFNRNQQSPEEVRLRMAYVSAENSIIESVQKELASTKTSATGTNARWARWLNARYTYGKDKEFVTQTFLSPHMQRVYAQASQRETASEQAGRNAMMHLPNRTQSSSAPYFWYVIGILGILLFASFILVFIGRLRAYGHVYTGGNRVNSPGPSQRTDFQNRFESGERPTCSRCNGSGSIDCLSSSCRSGYLYTGGTSFSEHCPACLGRGEISCPSCGGSGHR